MWGPKEFAQFTEEELHATMMESQPGSNYFEWARAELEHRDRRPRVVQNNALRLLQAIYDCTSGQDNPVFVTELDIGLGEEEAKVAWRYLKEKGLIQTFKLPYTARVNAAGVDAIENARRHPDVPASGFPLTNYNVVNIGTAIHSPVQQAGERSIVSHVTPLGGEELSTLGRLVAELTSHLGELELDARQKQKAEAQVATIKAQLGNDPNPVIVQEAGCTLRSIIEGAIASLIANAAQPTVWHWVHQAMANLFPK
jgi:hypothetical protein